MPNFEYHCQACGYEFERIRKVEDRDYTACPFCCTKATRRMSVVNHRIIQIGKVRVNGQEVASGL